MNYWTASFFCPGWGQWCQGRFGIGLLFLAGAVGGFWAIGWWFAVLVWLFNLRDAWAFRGENSKSPIVDSQEQIANGKLQMANGKSGIVNSQEQIANK
jgi:hypothetical protein